MQLFTDGRKAIILGLAGIALLIGGVGIVSTTSNVIPGHSLRSGIYLQGGATIAIAIATIVEVARELAAQSSAEITAEFATSSGD